MRKQHNVGEAAGGVDLVVLEEQTILGAAAVILHHNHLSGLCKLSRSDEALTQTVRGALALIDVRALDLIIPSDQGALSMAERGML